MPPTLFVHRLSDGNRLAVLTDDIPEIAVAIFNGLRFYSLTSPAQYGPA